MQRGAPCPTWLLGEETETGRRKRDVLGQVDSKGKKKRGKSKVLGDETEL